MMNTKNKFLLFFGTTILSTLSMSFVGKFYDAHITPISSGFWGPSNLENITGFIFSFLFLGSLLSWIFAEKKKKYWLSYTLPFLIFMLLLGAFEELIIGIGLVLIGWLLAQGVLWVLGKMKK